MHRHPELAPAPGDPHERALQEGVEESREDRHHVHAHGSAVPGDRIREEPRNQVHHDAPGGDDEAPAAAAAQWSGADFFLTCIGSAMRLQRGYLESQMIRTLVLD